jgi:c(7)-type cytochrome triheme protein
MRWRIIVLLGLALVAAGVAAQEWARLKDDGIRDPRSPALRELMDPGDALGPLANTAPDKGVGNQVRWVKLMESGAINPRSNIFESTPVRVLDLDIFLDIGGSLPAVRFPHRAHTQWLDCKNCHEHLFKSKVGTTEIRMLKILEGEQCGVCHGAVAFPLTECFRCHNTQQSIVVDLDRQGKIVRGPNNKAAIVK